MLREQFPLTLTSAKMITPTVKHLEFSRQDGQTLDYVPGQFITFHFEIDGVAYNRSYSIASIPSETQHIAIAASPFKGGPGTRFLFGLEIGDQAMTTGPFGRLILRDEQPKRLILVATGTGVTPYRCMLPQLQQRAEQHGIHIHILQGVQTPEDLLYGDDFLRYEAQCDNIHFHACYSRHQPEADSSYEHHGYVQQLFPQFNLQPEEDIVYLCGNPNMIDEAFATLTHQGFSTRQIRREKYISPKR